MTWNWEKLNKKLEKEKKEDFEAGVRKVHPNGINLLKEDQKKNIFDKLKEWANKEQKPDSFSKKVLTVIGLSMAALIGILIFSLLGGLFVKIFWNWLMPDLFGLTIITYWQGWGISAFSAVLFKGGSSGK